jgi:nitrile hydratase accessory protein
MTDDSPIRPDPADGPTFDAPWQARAFALAVALTDERDLDWERFQSRLVAEIDDPPAGDADDPDEDYYRRWLAALERLLVEEDLLPPGDLRERVAAFADGDRTAHEFVDGDPRGHVDRLPADHAEGSAHDHGHGDDHDHDH